LLTPIEIIYNPALYSFFPRGAFGSKFIEILFWPRHLGSLLLKESVEEKMAPKNPLIKRPIRNVIITFSALTG
jgi:hypothetical protein